MTERKHPSEPEDRKVQGRTGGGDSGGGAYPNPHTGKEGEGENEGWMGHGGQSDMNYFGHGRLGGKDVGGNANAPAEGAEDDD